MKLVSLFLISCSLSLLVACSSAPIEAGDPVPFTVLATGVHSTYKDSMEMEIGDRERLLAVWKSIHRDEKDLPDIDFARQSVLAVFLGQQATGGYRIEVERIVDNSTEWQVYVRIHKPAEGSMVTQALTQPYTLISVPYDWKIINYYYDSRP